MKNFWIILTIVLFWTVTGFSKPKSNFEVWQLPSQINTIGNSYVFRMNDGKVAVMDGGVKEEAPYLRGFLAALGNKVDVWFVSHPHDDHVGALAEILKDPKDLKIEKIYHSGFSPELYGAEPGSKEGVEQFYELLKKSGIQVEDIKTPGMVITLDQTSFKILGVKNEDLRMNPYNNSSMIIRVWDNAKSMVFLGDCGSEESERLLKSPFRNELDCDYLQMAHHGQQGASKHFYRTVKFKACLWPSPSWVYNNDIGKGFNTHILKTIEIRDLVDSLGIKTNYISWKGLYKIKEPKLN
ncbi:MAG TPA: MBL fold metallo-hydrolase [Kiritimatiellia bacterium]|nr:MBL fold metallo-hydrolase [Kiritimatiellia bacterium]